MFGRGWFNFFLHHLLEHFAAVNYAWRLALWDLVAAGPDELHLVRRVEHALDVEVAHGRVKGEDVEIALTVQHKVSSVIKIVI